MEELINGFIALNNKQKEYFIQAIAPEICKTFQRNAESIPKFCTIIKTEAEKNHGEMITEQLYQSFAPSKE